MNQNPSSPTVNAPTYQPMAEWIFISVVLLLEALTWFVAPGYYIPMFNHPIGKLIAIPIAVWQLIGLALLGIPGSPFLKMPAVARWMIVPMFFVMPFVLTMMLGPAIVTIVQALGPVMETGK